MINKEIEHSVTLDVDKCKGCTSCVKHCPTEAIRVRNGKAMILKERCIDCGECIRVCPSRAKKAVCDGFEVMDKFKYKIALPAPSLYGQFNNLNDINYVLEGLLNLGFDDVYEVSRAAEMVSDYTRRFLREFHEIPRPAISSACPAVVRLIMVRFPKLLPNVLPIIAPYELAAKLAKEEAMEKTGLRKEDIGAFFISPCPAKATDAKNPVGFNERFVDGVLPMNEVYMKLLGVMKNTGNPKQLSKCGLMGIGWAANGGESAALLNEKYIAVDGIENVIKILEEIELDKLPELEFIELNACFKGCIGGCLTIENPFVAHTRLKKLMKYMPVSENKFTLPKEREHEVVWEQILEYKPVLQLDSNMLVAMQKMREIERIHSELAGLDCGSCGAPSCRALAEDVIRGIGSEDDCIFKVRERMMRHEGNIDDDLYLPPPFRKAKMNNNTEKDKGDGAK